MSRARRPFRRKANFEQILTAIHDCQLIIRSIVVEITGGQFAGRKPSVKARQSNQMRSKRDGNEISVECYIRSAAIFLSPLRSETADQACQLNVPHVRT